MLVLDSIIYAFIHIYRLILCTDLYNDSSQSEFLITQCGIWPLKYTDKAAIEELGTAIQRYMYWTGSTTITGMDLSA